MRNFLIAVVAAMSLVPTARAAAPAKAPEPAKAEEKAAAPAPGKIVDGEGEAAIIDNDTAAAKEKAKEAALRDAVQKAVGTYVTSGTETRDATVVQDYVIAHTAGYVRDWKKISEEVVTAEQVVKTKVRAEVAQAELDKDAMAIKTLIAARKQKRVYVSIDDVSTNSVGAGSGADVATIRHGVFDTRFRDALRQDGFTCIDPSISDGKLKSKASIQSIKTVQEALEIANIVGADIVVYGHATATTRDGEIGTPGPNEKPGSNKVVSAIVSVDLHVSSTDSREVLADYADTTNNLKVAFTPQVATQYACDAAAAKALKTVRAGLFEAWRKKADAAEVDLTVTGVPSFGVLGSFKDLLRNQVRSVKDLTAGSFEKNVAKMQVTIAGSVETFASELDGKSFKGLKVSVVKTTNNTLEVALSK